MKTAETINIKPINLQTLGFVIVGTAPYVQHKFSQKARAEMRDKQEAGDQRAKGKRIKPPRDFEEDYLAAQHISREGWVGIPAPAFRSAIIACCRLVNFKMTLAKLSVFVQADGFGEDGTPLVKITKGEPQEHEAYIRNPNSGTASVVVRPMWHEGWEALVRVTFDADQFSGNDVANLLERAGTQVGIGEGRPNSKASDGMGWGTFSLKRG